MVRRSGRGVEPVQPLIAADPAGARHVLPRALVERHRAAAGRPARQNPSLHAEMGGRRRKVLRRRGDPRLQSELRAAPARRTAVRQDRLPDLADRPDPGLRGGRASPGDDPGVRSSTSASRCRGISPSSRPCRSTRRSRRQGCRSACRSSAGATMITACSSSRKPSRPRAARSRTGRRRRTDAALCAAARRRHAGRPRP